MIVKFFLVMIAIAIVDVFWTWYIQFSGDRKAFKAAGASTMIMFIGAFATTNYVHDNILILAAGIGAFLGTYFTVKFTKRKVDEPVKESKPTTVYHDWTEAGFEFPNNPKIGRTFYNASLGTYNVWDGVEWKKYFPRQN